MYKEDSAIMGSQDILVTIVTRLWDGQVRNHGSIPGRGKRFSIHWTSRVTQAHPAS